MMCSRNALSLDLEVGVSDALLLESLTEDSFISNLHQRFKRDQIYTYIGNMVISVNPYKRLSIYNSEIIEAYQTHNMYGLPPHIFALADNAYEAMKSRNQDQCLIIYGESGSGKTESAKMLLQYVTASGKDVDTAHSVRIQLLNCNVILEAFGNAKTARNDNASRFGKFLDIEYDFKGDPVGGIINNFILEKSRVTNVSSGERNFHIFYQLLTGAEVQFLKSLKLHRNIESYNILKVRNYHLETMDDKNMFFRLKKAFEDVGFSAEEVSALFQIVAVVLKLGNIEFLPHANMDGTEGCVIQNEYEIDDVCDLLRCEVQLIQSALTQKMVEARLELLMTDLTATEASCTRDLLCKSLYNRLFLWIIGKINECIKFKKQRSRRSLGILDMYGFEVFEKNSFEQLIINYCNERLQNLFIETSLKLEQEEYAKEGIQWTPVDFYNNDAICDLIDKNNNGILAILDEESLRMGHVTDDSLLKRIDQQCGQDRHYESSNCTSNPSSTPLPDCSFRIRHYAGKVIYSIKGMLEKNNDLLSRDLTCALYQCDHLLIKTLFPEGNPKRTTLKRPTTVATQFKISLNALLKTIQSRTPHYVCCIKPNELKQPRIFEMALVQHQVRYLGLMETLQLQLVGFAFHQPYDAFLARYKMLSLNTWPTWRGLPAEGITYLLRDLPIPSSEYSFGRTQIFIRSSATMFDLEEFRRLRLDELACLIQKTFRGWKQRKLFLKMKRSQQIIAAYWRGYKLFKLVHAFSVSQSRFMDFDYVTYDESTKPLIQLENDNHLDDFHACISERGRFQGLKLHRKTEWAALVIQKAFKNWKKRQYLKHLSKNLPSLSPICKAWPTCPRHFQETSRILWRLYHKWRCHKYRQQFDQTSRNKLREKVTASIIFKDKKSSYPRSVGQQFIGDYFKLRKNTKWQKISRETHDRYLVFAGVIAKVARSSGKCLTSISRRLFTFAS
ncbi:hypothetical protein CHUAL_007499 [Chamberlinius hualienensis]